ncbi:MAG: hypothetical protein KGL95_01475, partial [Patescibacteria group bacterium]|nr:hypothetical protein [Patescibacteria group bacterium]
MKRDMPLSFAELFKKYRLKSEFDTLSDFGNALAEKGYIYEDSIFSHWQKGTRIPTSRELLLTLLCVFSQKGAIHTVDEANNFLESVRQGYLTEEEKKKIPQFSSNTIPFQPPREVANFTGRRQLMKSINKYLAQGSVLLLHGPSGVGKTALAIHLGHMLKDFFPDGTLWYNIEKADLMEILLSIAFTFNENISPIQDLEVRASLVRSLLANKKVLLILDNAELDANLQVLLPNSSSSVIITSQYQSLIIDSPYEKIAIPSFSSEELIELFTKVLPQDYVEKYHENILQLGQEVDNLPLAAHIYAKELAQELQPPQILLEKIKKNTLQLEYFSYENKNLYVSIDTAYTSLEKKIQNIFLSLAIFEGKDFSLEAVAAINKMHIDNTYPPLQKLINVSLLEESTKNRYRLHPLVKQYIRNKSKLYSYIIDATTYYVKFLEKNKK